MFDSLNIEPKIEWKKDVEPFSTEPKTNFMSDCFPHECEAFIKALSSHLVVDESIVGMLLLGISALATQRNTIRLKKDWAEPLCLFVAVIANPGESKSPILKALSAPLDEWQSEHNKAIKKEIAKASARKDVLKRRAKILEDQAINDDKFISELEEVKAQVDEIDVPVNVQLYASDCTSEKLAIKLEEQKGALGILSAEGSFFTNLLGHYSNGKITTESVCKAFNAETIVVDRVSRPSIIVENARLSIVSAIQPYVWDRVAKNETLKGTGVLGRFVVCKPPESIGKRRFNTPDIPENVRAEYHNRIKSLLDQEPRELAFSDEAKQAFIDFNDRHQSKLENKEDFADLEEWASKHPGIVARVSAILELLESPFSNEVSEENMLRAITFSDYLQEQAKYVYTSTLSPRKHLASYLLDRINFLCEKGKIECDIGGNYFIKFGELSRNVNKASLKRKEDYTPYFQVLEAMGYITSTDGWKTILLSPNAFGEYFGTYTV